MSNALLPCPFCGFPVDSAPEDDLCYPIKRDRSLWAMNCPDVAGGCGASMVGRSEAECVKQWNRRAPSAAPAPAVLNDAQRAAGWREGNAEDFLRDIGAAPAPTEAPPTRAEYDTLDEISCERWPHTMDAAVWTDPTDLDHEDDPREIEELRDVARPLINGDDVEAMLSVIARIDELFLFGGECYNGWGIDYEGVESLDTLGIELGGLSQRDVEIFNTQAGSGDDLFHVKKLRDELTPAGREALVKYLQLDMEYIWLKCALYVERNR